MHSQNSKGHRFQSGGLFNREEIAPMQTAMNIVATLRNHASKETVLLGRFRSFEQALELLCPPTTRIAFIGKPGHPDRIRVRQHSRPAGLCLSDEKRDELLTRKELTFVHQYRVVTVFLFEEPVALTEAPASLLQGVA
jgi:hypothetical protein